DRAELWSSVIGEGALSVPAFYEGVLYFGSDDGNLYALNATSGLELWNYQISSPISLDSSSWRIGGVGLPVVCDGVLFVGCGEGVFALAVSSSFVLPSLPFYLPSSLVLLIVEVVAVVVVVVVVCCVWLYLFKKRNRLKTSL
ncbi:MAG: PQQ-like beta-propeller repeat protein, partial [Nitrososphaerota archaeon]|nr:PQQ-like beta-propeller repeat protein [Nitrososphaerota archaeon]